MKAWSALTCVLAATNFEAGNSVSLRASVEDSSNSTRRACCPGNLYPGDCTATISATGKAKYDDIFTVDNLASTPHWKVGKKWTLTVTVSSTDQNHRIFGFAGGNDGFLKIHVPPGVENKQLTVTDKILAGVAPLPFEYRFSTDEAASATPVDGITFKNICLVPTLCKGYVCSDRNRWRPKANFDTIPGHTDQECCDAIMCDAHNCQPASKWTIKTDANLYQGNTNAECCTPKICTASLCDATHTLILGNGIMGSTQDECCEPARCSMHKCSQPWMVHKKVPPNLMGKDDATCCDEPLCSEYTCDPAKLKPKPTTANGLKGATDELCCDKAYCTDYTCSSATKWKKKVGTIQGNNDEQCCERITCSGYRCTSADLQLITGAIHRQGSTDAECCEKKFCKDYQCSDAALWTKKPLMENLAGGGQVQRRGHSDAECCQKNLCSNFNCLTNKKWKEKTPQELAANGGLAGTTHDKCCDPVFCSAYSCSSSTKWYKKVDTNSYRWQGADDLDCCEPKWCVSYYTGYPTKWKRKVGPDGKVDASLKGSTDDECYDPRFCKDYACVDTSKVLIPNADKTRGSTDQECCVPP